MLPIDSAELIAPDVSDYLAMRRRLYQPESAAEVARREAAARRAAEDAKARVETERLARIAAEAMADRERVAAIVAKFKSFVVTGDCRLSTRQILDEVSAKHGFSVDDITGPSRVHPLVVARQEAMYRLVTERPHMSYQDVGRKIGARDHSTIVYGARKHARFHGLPLPNRSEGWSK
jgi:chromosomal replication initiation ATPase DnaA